MMEKRFRLEMFFRAEIDDGEIDGADLPPERMIKTFIKELARHPEALLAHYKQNLLHVRVNDDDNHTLKRLLKQKEDDRHLLEVAALCPDEIKHFIQEAYSPSNRYMPQSLKIEKEQAVISVEDKLGPLQITGAVFTMINP
jgi:hypothetical protein